MHAVRKSLAIVGAGACLAIVAMGCGSSSTSSTALKQSIIAEKFAAARAKAVQANVDRIKNYGSEAGGAEKAAVVAAMRSFTRGLAARDYAKVCAGLLSKVRTAIERFAKLAHKRSEDCAAFLSDRATIQASAAAKAANGTVTSVRVGGGTAYVLFRPAGGDPLSYFTTENENGKWKATGLGTGVPLNPAA